MNGSTPTPPGHPARQPPAANRPRVLSFPGRALSGPRGARYFDSKSQKAPGSFGTGDLASCGQSFTHGVVTASQAAGNASSGPFTADGIDWNNDGTVDDYGDPNTSDACGPGFCFFSGPVKIRVDGTAPGARVVFQDVNNICPEPTSFSFGSYNTLLTDARSKGARLHTFSFGAYNTATGTIYDASAQAIDAFLSTDANRDYMMFVAAGNNGTASNGTGGFAKEDTLSNEASAKNAIAVGSNNSGSAAALQGRS